jgi:hypothetical protein
MFMRASFSIYPISLWERVRVRENKKPFIHNRDEELSPRYHPVYVQGANVTLIAITGFPVADYFISPAKSSCEKQASSVSCPL